MTRETSIHLDLVRLVAALLVLVVHSYGGGMTGGFLWQLKDYGQTAVMVFFVLSGYVISYVARAREDNLHAFLSARAARLYSVIIPALVITFTCNELGWLIREAYRGPWDAPGGGDYLKYIATLFMVQEIWSAGWSPVNNGPFWSITYEAIYYLMFASLLYGRSHRARFGVMLVLMLLSGPTVVALFPIWLLGGLAFRLHTRDAISINIGIAWAIFLATLLALIASPLYRSALGHELYPVVRASLLGDYLDGVLFFMHLLVAPVVVGSIGGALRLAARPIVFLSSVSFSLYLFHQPLVRFFAGISPFIEQPGAFANRLFVFGCLFGVVFAVGLPAERWKRSLNELFERRISLFRS